MNDRLHRSTLHRAVEEIAAVLKNLKDDRARRVAIESAGILCGLWEPPDEGPPAVDGDPPLIITPINFKS